jgi:hypothetical protein
VKDQVKGESHDETSLTTESVLITGQKRNILLTRTQMIIANADIDVTEIPHRDDAEILQNDDTHVNTHVNGKNKDAPVECIPTANPESRKMLNLNP